MFLYPLHSPAGILQLSRILVLGSQTVAEIHDGESPLSQPHAIMGVAHPVAVDPAAAVDTDNSGQGLVCPLGTVDIQRVPDLVTAIADGVEALDVLRGGESFIADIVASGEILADLKISFPMVVTPLGRSSCISLYQNPEWVSR